MSTADDAVALDKVYKDYSEAILSGATLKKLMGLSDHEMAAVYALGYNLYNQAKYLEAAKAFAFLVQHDHYERKYYKALGSALQMLKRYKDALQNYGMAATLDLTDPEPNFHAAECLIALGMLTEARDALEACIGMCANKPGTARMAERANAMLDIVRQKIK
jgi:type III secretion system low calcium response chaperone LcrH/SycD